MTKHYKNLDGIRAYACIGIISMHILDNGFTSFSGFIFKELIPAFTNLTFLFMMLSAFSLCCGYYNRFIAGNYNLEQFYWRRVNRIWPCFALLSSLELILDHNITSLYEWFANITLTLGLIPNHNISIVGVGWFLGVVVVFYMVFPLFVVLIKNKKRAWITLP